MVRKTARKEAFFEKNNSDFQQFMEGTFSHRDDCGMWADGGIGSDAKHGGFHRYRALYPDWFFGAAKPCGGVSVWPGGGQFIRRYAGCFEIYIETVRPLFHRVHFKRNAGRGYLRDVALPEAGYGRADCGGGVFDETAGELRPEYLVDFHAVWKRVFCDFASQGVEECDYAAH